MSGGDEHFLARWSRRKREAKREPEAPGPEALEAGAPSVAATAPPAEATPAEPQPAQPQPLPPVESLTPQSDFTGFMKPEVDPGLRSQALKTLFQDPHFNVMDGLDVYIDDYSKPDPLPEGWLAKMNQVARLGAYVPPAPAAEGQAKEEPATVAQAQPQEALPDVATSPETPQDIANMASNEDEKPAPSETSSIPVPARGTPDRS